MLGGIGDRRRRGPHRMGWLNGITNLIYLSLCEFGSWWWPGKPGVLQFMGLQRFRPDWVTELNWTEVNSKTRISSEAERDRYISLIKFFKFWMGLPWWLSGKEFTFNAGYATLIPRLGRSPGEGNGNPLQYSHLGNPMDREAWRATVHGVTKESDTT